MKTELWPKGYEQHINFLYLVKAIDEIDFDPSEREVTDIAWFSQSQLEQVNVSLEIKDQFYHGLKIIKQYGQKPFFTKDYLKE
ncbi:MAG: hypothetical protein U9O78_00735 [Patescibacteria group bacterium]|nr:hypothetical protein [Patescibacteria group bacterium]